MATRTAPPSPRRGWMHHRDRRGRGSRLRPCGRGRPRSRCAWGHPPGPCGRVCLSDPCARVGSPSQCAWARSPGPGAPGRSQGRSVREHPMNPQAQERPLTPLNPRHAVRHRLPCGPPPGRIQRCHAGAGRAVWRRNPLCHPGRHRSLRCRPLRHRLPCRPVRAVRRRAPRRREIATPAGHLPHRRRSPGRHRPTPPSAGPRGRPRPVSGYRRPRRRRACGRPNRTGRPRSPRPTRAPRRHAAGRTTRPTSRPHDGVGRPAGSSPHCPQGGSTGTPRDDRHEARPRSALADPSAPGVGLQAPGPAGRP